MAVTAVKGDHERHGHLSVRRLGNIEGEPAADFALVRCVQDAPPRLVVAQGGGAQALDESVVVASRRLEEPATHRLERRGERIERLLDAGEAAEGPVQANRLARRAGRLDEVGHQVQGLPRHLDEPIPHEAKLVRAHESFHGAQRSRDGIRAGSELLGQPRGQGRIEVPLHPRDVVERAQKRRQQRADRLDGVLR